MTQKAKVDWARICLWKEPGSAHYVTFLMKNDVVEVIQGWEYSDRPWKDKHFVKVVDKSGHEGFVLANALKPTK